MGTIGSRVVAGDFRSRKLSIHKAGDSLYISYNNKESNKSLKFGLPVLPSHHKH